MFKQTHSITNNCENVGCEPNQWCVYWPDSEEVICKDYAEEGDDCETYGHFEEIDFCNPETHFCFKTMDCIIPDVGGICVPLGTKAQLGDCCYDDSHCESNLCAEGEVMFGIIERICQVSPCIDLSCTNDQWCAEDINGTYFCKDYLLEGETCFSSTPEHIDRCNATHFCYEPKFCINDELGGVCRPNSGKYELGDCCSRDKDCKSNFCLYDNVDTMISTCQITTCEKDGIFYENGHQNRSECIDSSHAEILEFYCLDGDVIKVESKLECHGESQCYQCGDNLAVCKEDTDTYCEQCIKGSMWVSIDIKDWVFDCPCPGSEHIVQKIQKYLFGAFNNMRINMIGNKP